MPAHEILIISKMYKILYAITLRITREYNKGFANTNRINETDMLFRCNVEQAVSSPHTFPRLAEVHNFHIERVFMALVAAKSPAVISTKQIYRI